MSSMADMTVTTKTTIGIQAGILVAIIVGVFEVGYMSARAQVRLEAIEQGGVELKGAVDELKGAVQDNGANVTLLSTQISGLDTKGTAWARDWLAAMDFRVTALEKCSRCKLK